MPCLLDTKACKQLSTRHLCHSLKSLHLLANDQVSAPTPLQMTAAVDFLAEASKCCREQLLRWVKAGIKRMNFRQLVYSHYLPTHRPAIHSLVVLSSDLSSACNPARSEYGISCTVSKKSETFVCVPRNHQKKVRELTANQMWTLEESGLFELAKCPEHKKSLEKKTTKIIYAYTKK